MTDRHTDHRAAAEGLLADADDWGWQAGESSPKASERACLAYATVHALLAIHDTLTAAAANEAKRREAEPDPLDEGDHRDRLDACGTRWTKASDGCWASGAHHVLDLASLVGPLTSTPKTPRDATDGAPSASQVESGAVEGGSAPVLSTRRLTSCVERWPDCASGEYNPACCRFPKSCSPLDTDGAQEPLVCPECDHHINTHVVVGCWCDCPRTPEDVALALIARAVPVDIRDAR